MTEVLTPPIQQQPGPPSHNNNDDELEASDVFTELPMPVTPRSVNQTQSSTGSPRCEAFVMTGDKMLRLNSKISPSYAQARQDMLPPSSMPDVNGKRTPRGPFDDLPMTEHKTSKHRRQFVLDTDAADGDMPNSQSAHALGQDEKSPTTVSATDAKETGNATSCVTVNAAASHVTLPSPTVNTTPLKHQQTHDHTLVIRVDKHGNEHLVSMGASQSGGADAARRLAKRMYCLDGVKKTDVGAILAKSDEFSAQVAREYLSMFNFAGLRIDAAVRKLMSQFCLVGESSERERVLQYFSHRYHECNPGLFANEDEVHTLTCALLLLNSDLHGPNIGKRMTCHEFIDNLSHTGYKYKRDVLKSLYQSIKNAQIEWTGETTDESAKSSSAAGTSTSQRSTEQQVEEQVVYHKGWVMRKCVYDENAKRTPFGRRSWRMLYATLKGVVLYLHKDEQGFNRGQYQTYRNAIRVLHAHAHTNSTQHSTKRPNTFTLRTATGAEYLFQASDQNEVHTWVDKINFVAACFSSPPLPAPVSSQSTAFHRPLLPSATTRLSLPEQLAEHERQVADLDRMLSDLKLQAPSMNAKGRQVHEYFYRERYLEEEKQRFATYVHLLSDRLGDRCGAGDVSLCVSPLHQHANTIDNTSASYPNHQSYPQPPSGVLVVSSPHHFVSGGSAATTTNTSGEWHAPHGHNRSHHQQNSSTSNSNSMSNAAVVTTNYANDREQDRLSYKEALNDAEYESS